MKYKTCLLVLIFSYLTVFTVGRTYQIYLPVMLVISPPVLGNYEIFIFTTGPVYCLG